MRSDGNNFGDRNEKEKLNTLNNTSISALFEHHYYC